jgi:ADP-heptose:LPS heptosyltransferase
MRSRELFQDGNSASTQSESKEAVIEAPSPSKRPRILVVRAGAIGDTLFATPLVRALRRTYADAYLVFLCSRPAYDLVKYNPHLDQVLKLGGRHVPAWLSREKSRLFRGLKRLNLDWAIVLESHPGLLDVARRAGAARTIAYKPLPGVEGFEQAGFDPKKHAIENNLAAAEPLALEPAGLEMELYYPAAFNQRIEERLAAAGIGKSDRLAGLHAGWGRGKRNHSIEDTRLRSWPPDRFAKVARWLEESAGARVVLTGSPADKPLTAFIAREAGVPCLDLAGRLSLLELAALIRRLDLYVTIESGPAHMAAALGTPLVTLVGPSIWEQTRPLASAGPLRVLYERVPCAPCYNTPLMKSCQDNICMKQIEVGQVQEAIRQVFAAAGSGPLRMVRDRS